jgi:hypothetical protein
LGTENSLLTPGPENRTGARRSWCSSPPCSPSQWQRCGKECCLNKKNHLFLR